MATKLDEEIAYYEAISEELFREHPDEFVLIKGSSKVGVFSTELEAIKRGYEEFGNEAFLVRQITNGAAPILFTSLLVSA